MKSSFGWIKSIGFVDSLLFRDSIHPYEWLIFILYLRDFLGKNGFYLQSRILDFYLAEEISFIWGEYSSVPKEQKPKGGYGGKTAVLVHLMWTKGGLLPHVGGFYCE